MINPEHVYVQLGQKAIFIRDGRCLILEGSNRADTWDLPGGRLHIGEDPAVGFRRELEEEIGLKQFSRIATVDYDVWIREKDKPVICLVANLIQSDHQNIVLSAEHRSFKWITLAELDSFTFYSEAMPRMIQKGFEHLHMLDNAR